MLVLDFAVAASIVILANTAVILTLSMAAALLAGMLGVNTVVIHAIISKDIYIPNVTFAHVNKVVRIWRNVVPDAFSVSATDATMTRLVLMDADGRCTRIPVQHLCICAAHITVETCIKVRARTHFVLNVTNSPSMADLCLSRLKHPCNTFVRDASPSRRSVVGLAATVPAATDVLLAEAIRAHLAIDNTGYWYTFKCPLEDEAIVTKTDAIHAFAVSHAFELVESDARFLDALIVDKNFVLRTADCPCKSCERNEKHRLY